MKNTIFNRELIDKYVTQGPRYTSYPTAVQFDDSFTSQSQEQTNKLVMKNYIYKLCEILSCDKY